MWPKRAGKFIAKEKQKKTFLKKNISRISKEKSHISKIFYLFIQNTKQDIYNLFG